MSKINTEQILLNNEKLKKVLLDWEYPIGKGIKITFDNVNPGAYLGGTWEALPEGYALWTTTTSGQGGKTIAAGLPNITGTLEGNYCGRVTPNITTGAFSTSEGSSKKGSQGNDGTTGLKLNFNASSANSIYKDNFNTVQPPAIKIFVWKRVG